MYFFLTMNILKKKKLDEFLKTFVVRIKLNQILYAFIRNTFTNTFEVSLNFLVVFQVKSSKFKNL